MRPVLLIWLMMVLVAVAPAQIPRDNTGDFQYYGEVLTDNSTRSLERAKAFFNQPFLIHWDTVAHKNQPTNFLMTGKGYINVRAKQHGIAVPSIIPVALHMSIQVEPDRYRFTINHFEVMDKEGKSQYALEAKPDSVKRLVYDQLLQNTHKRVSFVIGWFKKYMQGE